MIPRVPIRATGRCSFAEETRRKIEAQVSDVLDRIEDYEFLIQQQASAIIRRQVEAVLRRISHHPSFPQFDNGYWPYLSPIRDVGLMEHLFWARYEYDFPLWKDSFYAVVSHECLKVMHTQTWDDGVDFEFLMSACRIQNGPTSIEDMQARAAGHLTGFVWSELMNLDMSTLFELGIADPFRRASDIGEDEV